jgi:nicotinamidase-related amidase
MNIDPTTTAVVAVHLENDVVAADGFLAGMFRQQVEERAVLTTAAAVLEGARAAGIPVLYTRVAFKADYSDMHANSPMLAGSKGTGGFVVDTHGTEIAAEVAPGPDDVVVTHQRVGGFQGSTLQRELDARDVRTVVILGVATNVSVESTARWATDLGYDVVLVEDACSAATLEAHQASVASLGMLAEIVASDDALRAFAG